MEIRVLQYFLAIAREQTFSAAAQTLHISQPSLSRQIKDLERELGTQLMIRGSRKITLTADGVILHNYAEAIDVLVEKIKHEVGSQNSDIAGKIQIGCGEIEASRIVVRALKRLTDQHPGIAINMVSGDALDILASLETGVLDFCILIDPVDIAKHERIPLPSCDAFGVIMRTDDPLASKAVITAEDLYNQPLIVSRQQINGDLFSAWLKKDYEQIDIVAVYNLPFNAGLMVKEGLGYAVVLDGIVDTSETSGLAFRPCSPLLHAGANVVWSKRRILSRASKAFLETLDEMLSE